ncbi:unnamed protein product [Phaedon cochleariae]|uniref:Uncharacterized protein n=1 Tax=Phaedon cochleariae TaxID=80249 RepID=A0A9P0DZB0_PHACE|nr:unnamed protein product [Phaedon cochleariae]
MSGVVFIICVPTETFERSVQTQLRKKVTINEHPRVIQRQYSNYEYLNVENDFENENSWGCKTTNGKDFKIKENLSMEKVLQIVLSELNITNSTWCKRDQDNYLQVIFSVESSDRCEEILEILKENEIGQKWNSIVSVIPCTIQYHGNEGSKLMEDHTEDDHTHKNTGWHQFITSVRARLTVAQVVENVKSHAALTFDFVFLILISTTMCAIGLVENSNVYLLSSMVMCPMMGPVMAGTFGSVIRHKTLTKIGIRNELIGMAIATLVGFCCGSMICTFTDKYGNQTWPTYEMISRGELRSLWVGCLIALLSGAVVALGILSDNIASLVGVAISTSITPPAVNAGLFWSMASVYYLKGDRMDLRNLTLYNYYSKNPIAELLALGAINICLTFANIICIYAAAILIFKVKEVAHVPSKDYHRRNFWKHDIKIARDYNKTLQHGEGDCLISKWTQELAAYQRRNYGDQLFHSTDLSNKPSKVTKKNTGYTWSPSMNSNEEFKKLRGLYERLLKEPTSTYGSTHSTTSSTSSSTVRNERHRRLSQIFVQEEDQLNTIDETSSKSFNGSGLSNESGKRKASKQLFCGKKKFTVTPCKIDTLKP